MSHVNNLKVNSRRLGHCLAAAVELTHSNKDKTSGIYHCSLKRQ